MARFVSFESVSETSRHRRRGWRHKFLHHHEGGRLYFLDSYVIPDGTVRCNAVWRPATHGEIRVYDWTYPEFRTSIRGAAGTLSLLLLL
jgi:hypothetical protein